MHIIHDLGDFDAPWQSSVLTLGVFDGMHKGHQVLVRRLQKRSRSGERARILVTYDPHPDLVLGKRKTSRRAELFTYREKLALLQNYDLDAAIFLPFTPELARMTALRYLKEILLGKLKAKHVIIGYDQCFGRGRKGNYDFLKQMSRRYDYKVERIGAVRRGRSVISSSHIRDLIASGEVAAANKLLGHEFFISGTVIRGFQRGQKLGFPTANIDVPETKVLPAPGVYVGVAERGPRRFRAMVNIGNAPTFGREAFTIEAHLLDFSDDLYGEPLRVYIRDRVRDEIKFDSSEALTRQLEADRAVAARVKL